MDLHKVFDKLILIAFVLMIAVPIATTRFSGGEISENEKRMLAEIPSTDNLGARIFNREFMQDTENWLNDHIGKRNGCRAVYAIIMYHGLNISTSSDVALGRDGYCFFTQRDNLEIGKGTYHFPDEDIGKIKEQYRKAKNYYDGKGIRFYLLLTPSKVSVYPEHLPFESNEQAVQPSELIEEAISDPEHVVNLKEKLISEKDKGKLFFLTDSHWNHRGTYAAYSEILRVLRPEETPIQESYGSDRRTGDLFQELGLIKDMDKEEVPEFLYDWNSRQLEMEELDSEFINALKKELEDEEQTYTSPEIFVNENGSGGTLLIYGDSMMAADLNVPRYLCEHYNKVVMLRARRISPAIEEMIEPDTVIYSSTERLLRLSLRQFAGK